MQSGTYTGTEMTMTFLQCMWKYVRPYESKVYMCEAMTAEDIDMKTKIFQLFMA